jgi:hypothetical protein
MSMLQTVCVTNRAVRARYISRIRTRQGALTVPSLPRDSKACCASARLTLTSTRLLRRTYEAIFLRFNRATSPATSNPQLASRLASLPRALASYQTGISQALRTVFDGRMGEKSVSPGVIRRVFTWAHHVKARTANRRQNLRRKQPWQSSCAAPPGPSDVIDAPSADLFLDGLRPRRAHLRFSRHIQPTVLQRGLARLLS